jgi:uncharacterized protein YlxP (DUF503 family)
VVVGVLRLDLVILESNSLKDKRSVLRSLIAGLQHQFQVSVAEVEYQDLWNRAGIGIAAVSSDARVVERLLQQIETRVETNPDLEIVSAEHELIHI